MPHNSELTLNSQLAAVLRTLNPAWEALSAERTQVLRAAAGQRPDILLPDPLLVLETEFAPAATVEADARQRLGTQLQATGRPVEQVLAVILPPSLQTAPQHLLDEAIRGARYQYCTHALTAAGAPTRWPALTRVFSGRESVAAAGAVGPPRVWQGQGQRGRLVSGSVRSGMLQKRQNCLSGGRVMRRTEAAGVWRERWRSAMWVPRRGRGWVQVPPGCTRRRRVLKSGPGVGRSHTQAHR